MKVLKYRGLDPSLVKNNYLKVVSMLERDDFYSAEVTKISGTKYYKAKLDYKNKLLFTIITYQQDRYALLLEIIYNHSYDRSRFLANTKINLQSIEPIINSLPQELENIKYLNVKNNYINVLDRFISLDPTQEQIFEMSLPLLIIGSAGSGKTLLALEKIKNYSGKILFITTSAYLVKYARKLYYSNNYFNQEQEIDFLSYQEFIETIKIPEFKPINFDIFNAWVKKYYSYKSSKDPNKLYEEFKGVLTAEPNNKYLDLTSYFNLGVKKSIFSLEERVDVYDLFTKYLDFIKSNKLYDSNILAYEYLGKAKKQYDLAVVDEVQDLTEVQLALIGAVQKRLFLGITRHSNANVNVRNLKIFKKS